LNKTDVPRILEKIEKTETERALVLGTEKDNKILNEVKKKFGVECARKPFPTEEYNVL